jgi:hypothetical protein
VSVGLRHSILLAAISVGLLADRADAQTCQPFAQRLAAWDLSRDVVVVAIWPGRDRPPPNVEKPPPNAFELRRISTGERLAQHDCGNQPACSYEALLAKDLPPGTRLGRRTQSFFDGVLNVADVHQDDRYEVALETKTRTHPAWQRVLWTAVLPAAAGPPQGRRAHFDNMDFRDGEAMVAFQVTAREGDCRQTFVRAFRMPRSDLERPDRAGRQAELLARPPRKDAPFEHWRTIAELGPLPTARLIEAMEAAEHAGQVDFAVRWWVTATHRLPRKEVAPLAQAVKTNSALAATRARLRL